MVKRNLRRRGVLHHIPTYPIIVFTTFTMQFATNNSNQTPAQLFPQVTGTYGRMHYTLDHAMRTITQVENWSFDKAFNGNGHYPQPSEVSNGEVGFGEKDVDINYCFRLLTIYWRGRSRWEHQYKTFIVGIRTLSMNALAMIRSGNGAFVLLRSCIWIGPKSMMKSPQDDPEEPCGYWAKCSSLERDFIHQTRSLYGGQYGNLGPSEGLWGRG